MTDEQIIKALKTLLELALYEGCQQRAKTISLAIDLINRQKAEKEALIAGQETLQKYIAEQKEENEHLQDLLVKANAEIAKQETEIENYIKVAETQQSLSMERFFEIERLSKRIEKRTTELDRLTIYFDKAVEEKLKTAKAEAIKEFAERLKNKLTATTKTIAGEYVFEISGDFINNLVKEMVGDTDG